MNFDCDLSDMEFNVFDYGKASTYASNMNETELREIIREFEKFARNEIYPSRQKGDNQGVEMTPDGVKAPECFHVVTKQYYQKGWFALGFPESVGGVDVPDLVNLAKVSLENSANMAWGLYPGLSRAALNVILQIGTPEQKKHYAPKIISGDWGGTMCLTEPNAGSDVGAVKTLAKPVGDGRYIISGNKNFISSGEHDLYDNIIHLILARTPNAPSGVKGLSLFLVPRYKINQDGSRGDSNGVHCSKVEEKMGLHGSATCAMTFENNCEGFLIGEELRGIENMFLMMNEARLFCGIQGESQGSLASGLSWEYAKQRVQFGRPIVDHPDVKRMLLKMRSICRGMRALLFYTAGLFDRMKQEDSSSSLMKEIALLTPVCKAYCTDRGFDVSVDAVQVHGGYGYCVEYGIEQFVRDSKVATIYEGTNGIQGVDLVMRKIMRDKGETFLLLLKKIEASLRQKNPWKKETCLISQSVKDARMIVKLYKEMAMKRQDEKILESSTDFLTFCGNLFVSWLLFEHALLSKKGKDEAFGLSKEMDFKIFSRYFLVQNTGITQSILDFSHV